jgi:glutamine synthetase
MAGIDGVKNKIDPEKEGYGPYDFNLYKISAEEKQKIKSLPRSLNEALDALEEDHDFLMENGVFPKKLIEIWIENRRAEAALYSQIPQPIEYSMYYDL